MTRNIKPIDFETFFTETIQKDILDALFDYKLINTTALFQEGINLHNPETKRFIYYLILYHIIKKIDESKSFEKNIIIVQVDIIHSNQEICEYCSAKDLNKIILKFLKILSKKYPDRVIILKKYMDLTSPDTIEYLFMRSNKAKTSNSKPLKEVFEKEQLKINSSRISKC